MTGATTPDIREPNFASPSRQRDFCRGGAYLAFAAIASYVVHLDQPDESDMIRVNLHRLGTRGAGTPRWAAWLAMAASLVVGVTLFLLAASLALILIPVIMVAGAIAMWRLKSRLKAAGFGQQSPFARQERQPGQAEIIDAEYRIIEQGEPPRR